MTFSVLKNLVGREPVTVIEADLDKCTNIYGGGLLSPLNGTCTGAQPSGSECFNARKGCHDTPNYDNSSILTLKLSDIEIDGEDYINCITSTKLAPVEISPGQPFGKRASIDIVLQDFPYHDRGIDPYVSTRSYIPEDQGTYFGKLLARNPYYQGRPLRLKTGYLTGESVDNSLLQSRNFGTTWTNTGTVLTQDQTGVDGAKNTAWQVEDDNAAVFENIGQSATILDDSSTHAISVFILKDSDTSRFPQLTYSFQGGTLQRADIQVNTSTGAITTFTSTGTYTSKIESHGDYWKLIITLDNNSSGNTSAVATFYPAATATWGALEATAIGTTIIDQFQLELNKSEASIGQVTTTTVARTGITDPADLMLMETQNYIIEKITGPDKNGMVAIVAKDILKLADDDRALCPAASTGLLVAGIDSSVTSLTVTSGTEGEYNAESDYIRIGDEVILAPAANRAANVFSNLTRGSWNTEKASHGIGDAVQACKHFDAVNVRDILEDLLVNYASIPSAYIPTADWDAEETLWLSGTNLTALITAATGVKTLRNELEEQTMIYNWWDSVNQEIKLKAIAPIATPTVELTDDDSFIKDPVITIKQEDRVSRVLIYYSPRTPIEFDSPEHFESLYGFIGTGEESADQYNDIRVKTIFARWITSDALATQTGSRTRNQFRDPPKFISFTVDAKDSGNVTGDYIAINTRSIQDSDGSNKATSVQILKSQEDTRKASGTHFKMTCQETQFSGRYGKIMANTSPDGDYSTATDAQKRDGCYIVAAGLEIFTSDIGEAYKIA